MLIALPSNANADLLNNSGFESPGGWWSNPDWWGIDKTADAAGTTNGGDDPYEGNWVFSVANDWGGSTSNASGSATQDLAPVLSTGDTVNFSMHIKTDAGYTGSAKIKVDFLDNASAVLGTALSSSYGAGTDWTLATASGIVPVGTTKLKAYCLSEAMGIGSKAAHFDDGSVSIDPIPEPTSLLLLSTGLAGLLGFSKRKRT